MSKIQYVEKRFNASTREIIDIADAILEEYQDEGLDLTVRQLYYQFVSRDYFPEDRKWVQVKGTGKWRKDPKGTKNDEPNYKWISTIISKARLAGLIDWKMIKDRTRNLKTNYHNIDPGEAVQDALDQFLLNKWDNQPYRPEVWIEKDALIGVIEDTCKELDVPYFACKGYNSQSEMWRASMRLINHIENGQTPVIIYLGDHDPSGIDMTRDIDDRNMRFVSHHINNEVIKIDRIALTWEQIQEYDPPPNPSKETDPRGKGYIEEYGESSWELDALEPRVMRDLIRETVDNYTDPDQLQKTIDQEDEYRDTLQKVVDNWETL